MSGEAQSFGHHTRWVPPFHFVILPILLVNVLWSIWQAFKAPTWPTILAALVAFAIFGVAIYGRNFALSVQDRVIRLEMRLRLERLLAADLKGRIPNLTVDQLVGLRFASDEELPALAREVFEKNIADRKEIKRRIKSWQADHLRA